MSRTFNALAVLLLVGGLAVSTGAAQASIKVGKNASSYSLKVTAHGVAQVTYRSASGLHRVVVRPTGKLRFGTGVRGRNVAARTTAVRLPLRGMAWRTPDGTFWGLQQWRRLSGAPLELRVSRWRGAATRLRLRSVCCKWQSEVISGTVRYHGRGVFGNRATPAGNPLDSRGRNVYMDSFHGGWHRMMGVLTHPSSGWYKLWIRNGWHGRRYRAQVIGPNWGRTLAPDDRARASSSR